MPLFLCFLSYTVRISNFLSTVFRFLFYKLICDFLNLFFNSLISSSDTSCFASFLKRSLASRRTLRTATFAASPFFLTSFTSSFRALRQLRQYQANDLPSLFGFKFKSEDKIALLISLIKSASKAEF